MLRRPSPMIIRSATREFGRFDWFFYFLAQRIEWQIGAGIRYCLFIEPGIILYHELIDVTTERVLVSADRPRAAKTCPGAWTNCAFPCDTRPTLVPGVGSIGLHRPASELLSLRGSLWSDWTDWQWDRDAHKIIWGLPCLLWREYGTKGNDPLNTHNTPCPSMVQVCSKLICRCMTRKVPMRFTFQLMHSTSPQYILTTPAGRNAELSLMPNIPLPISICSLLKAVNVLQNDLEDWTFSWYM